MSKNHVFRSIAIDEILEPQDQVRTVVVFEGLQELAEDIQQGGIIQPLIVLKKGDKFEIVDGHRRYLAAKMAGLEVVPCIIRGMDVKESDLTKLRANYFREDINPVDEAKFFVKLHEKHGLTFTEIARQSTRSDSYVLNRVQLLQADARVVAALEGKQLNFSQALEISKANDEGVRGELLRITVESGATVETLRGMRYDYERRITDQDPALSHEPPPAGNYADVKHLIECPVCGGKYSVNQIFPVSVCKTCYDGFMEGLKGAEDGRKK